MTTDDARPAATWVTPTRRLAHHLRTRFDVECVARGLDVWNTPDVVTWPGLIERMFATDRASGRISGRWLPDSAARLVWERIAERDPATERLVSPGLVGRAAYESWRRLHAYRIPLDALEAEDVPETRAFARWAREYSTWLARHGWVDACIALDRVDPAAAGPALELVGFDALTPAQQAFLERLRVAGVSVAERAAISRRGVAVRVDCADRTAELDTAARWAARKLDGRADLRLAIVVPGLAARRDEVRRTLERVLVPEASLAGGPAPESNGFELAAARPLSERPIVGSALAIIEAFARRPGLAVASRLLRNPFLVASMEESGARARLDARIRRHEGPDLDLARLALLADSHDCPHLARVLRVGLDLVRGWPQQALPSRWSRLWFEVLGALGWPGGGLDSGEHQAQERWKSLVAEFGACDDYVGRLGRGQAAALVADMARGILFEPQEIRAPLLVIDPETCAGMDFDALWVCGLDATRWPAPAAPDPFLPRDWQVRQRMPGANADIVADEARRVLERLRRCADEVVLSVPQFEDDAPLLPSALLADVPRTAPLDLWQEPAAAVAQFTARPVLECGVDGTMPPVPKDDSSRGGARLLELQAACPFRAQAEFRLGARPLEDPELGVAASERGQLVHDVLARMWNELRTQRALRRLTEDEARSRVRNAINHELEARGSTRGVMRGLLEIEAAWLEARVHELLAADLARPEFAVEGVEQDASLGIGGLTLALRIDRVDRLGDGSLAVIDYKTGADADPKSWLEERPKLPQLPLYAEAVGEEKVGAIAFGRVRTGDTGYRGLARAGALFPGLKSPDAGGWPKEFASWEDLLLAWRRRLATLAAEHVQGDARLAPNPTQACAYCTLGALCRIGETRLPADAEGVADE